MASIYKELSIGLDAAEVWDRLKDFHALRERLVPGFVRECRAEPGARVVTFDNGLVAREVLVGIDEQHRRLSYAVVGGRATQHAASAQVFDESAGRCRLLWITDVLPDELAEPIGAMMERGAAAMKSTLEASA
ncbi:MAG TPA: SRPBCC family protein [Polyangiaceae bacterium]